MRNLTVRFLLCLIFLASLAGPLPGSAAAAPSIPTGVYLEDFTTTQAKDFTRTSVWDPWNGQVRLQRSAIDQYMAAVAAAPDGGVYAAFTQADGLYAQRLDARGSRLWPAALRVSAGDYTHNWASNLVTVAALPQGGVIVVWYRDQILAQRISAGGTLLWAQPLEIAPSADAWASPSASVYPDGSFLVTWASGGARAMRVSADGAFLWDAPVIVSPDPAEQRFVRSALDASGNAVVAWYRAANEISGNIFAQSLDPDGERLWTDGGVQVNAESGVVELGYGSTLSLDCAPDGSAVVAWTSIYNLGTRIASAQRLDPNGLRLWPQDVRVSGYNNTTEFASLETIRPEVAVDAAGGAVVSFQADTPLGERIQMHAMYLTAAGQRAWAQDTTLTTDQPVIPFTPHTISITPSGEAWIGWYHGESEFHPYAHRLNTSGALLLDGPIPLMDDTGLSSQVQPALAAAPDGGALIAWEDNRRGLVDVYIARMDPAGQLAWETDIRVNGDDETARSNTNPRIAVDPQGSALVTYIRRYDNELQLFAQKIDKNGNKLWPAEVAITGRQNALSGAISIAAGSDGTFVITWLDDYTLPGTRHVAAQKLSPQGEKLWGAGGVTVNGEDALQSQMDPTVRLDAQNNAYVFWVSARTTPDSIPEDWAIFAQRVSPAGARLWPDDVRLSTDASEPRLWSQAVGALYPDGSLYVAWPTEAPDPASQLAGQRVSPEGALAWAAPRTISALVTPADAAPAPAADGGIYLSGVPCGECPARVIKVDDQGQGALTGPDFPSPPRLAHWPSGPVLAAYASTGLGPDIEVTSIEPAPTGSDWPVTRLAAPENFYLERGLIQSRTVDTLSENIARAALTASSEMNGGEIVYSLSNDGGVTWQTAIPGVMLTFPNLASDLRWRAELIRDPAWPRRSPLVTDLRIEYSAEVPNADRYETDDTCAQSVTLAADGVSQRHTLHTAGDSDWVRFEVTGGQTYVIQASEPEVNADVRLELFDQCGAASPLETQHNPYNGEAQIAFSVPEDGIWYAAAHSQGAGGPDSGYSLSVRVQESAPLVAIVAGPSDDPAVQLALQASADRVYRLFQRSTTRADIRYFAPDPARDVDGNGQQDDIFGAPTQSLLRDTIQDWARERGVQLGRPFYLFILADGQPGQLISQLEGGSVSPDALDLWLDNLEATTGADQINVILEAPYAGGFISGTPSLAGPKRVILAAAGPDQLAYLSADGAYFTNALVAGLDQRLNLREAFLLAAEDLSSRGLPQTPMLDDNGDGQPSQPSAGRDLASPSAPAETPDLPDGLAAAARGLPLAAAAEPPVVDQLALTDQGSGSLQVSVRARAAGGIEQVWLEIYPFVSSAGALVSPTRLYLQPAGQVDRYTVGGLSPALYQRLVITAADSQGHTSRPVSVITGYPVFLPLMPKK